MFCVVEHVFYIPKAFTVNMNLSGCELPAGIKFMLNVKGGAVIYTYTCVYMYPHPLKVQSIDLFL